MIIKIEKNKLVKVKIGNCFPEKGEVFCPFNWGTDDINNFMKNIRSFTDFEINQNNPDDEFLLMEIE